MRALIASLDQKIGHLAIPNLIRVLAIFQAVTWLLIHLRPEFGARLIFSPALIKEGEWWRLISYIALPGGTGILWLLFIGFTFMLNDGLEEAWGSFRLNLYMLLGIVCLTLGGLVFGYVSTGAFLWAGVLMAFAVYFPNEEILLYFIIPVKVKWLAWLAAAGALFGLLSPGMRAEILCSLLNFILVFVPGLIKGVKHVAKIRVRRQRYDNAQKPAREPLYQCAKCGRTDIDHKALEFRVNADGEDICSDCRVTV
jgi:hypothetical protein